MKILITGGAEYIGSNLIDHSLHLGHDVVCLDDLSNGYEHTINHHFGNPLSPYAVTKYVNELYAIIFSKTYGMQCMGLRYFLMYLVSDNHPMAQMQLLYPCW